MITVEQKEIESVLIEIMESDSIKDIQTSTTADELKLMPGSLIKRLYQAWKSPQGIPNAHRRSIRHLQNIIEGKPIPSAYDKLRGFTGVQKKDVSKILDAILSHWYWLPDNEQSQPIEIGWNIPEITEKICRYSFSDTDKIFFVSYDGQELFRYMRQSPDEFGISFVSHPYKSLLYISDNRTPLHFRRAMNQYLEKDQDKRKGVFSWVIDLGNTNLGDQDAFLRYQNVWNLLGALKSLEVFPGVEEDEGNVLFNSHAKSLKVDAKQRVQTSLTERMAIIVHGLPKESSKRVSQIYEDSDGPTEPNNDVYTKLQKQFGFLSSNDFILPSPLALWPQESSLKIFANNPEPDLPANELNITNLVFVSPTENEDLELCSQYWSVGAPEIKNTNFDTSDNENSLLAIKMGSPASRIDSAFNLLYFAVSHRMKRTIFKPGDIRESELTMPGSHVIWLLRGLGFEIVTAKDFIEIALTLGRQ